MSIYVKLRAVTTVREPGVELPRRLKLVGMGAGGFLLLALLMVVVGYLLVPHFYLTRTTPRRWDGGSFMPDAHQEPTNRVQSRRASRFQHLSQELEVDDGVMRIRGCY
jgi:hypothetical protein